MSIPLYDCYYNPYQMIAVHTPFWWINHPWRPCLLCNVPYHQGRRCLATLRRTSAVVSRAAAPAPPPEVLGVDVSKKTDLGSSTVESLDEAWGWIGLNESCDGTAAQRLSPLLGSCCGASCSASCWSCSGHWMHRTPLKTHKFHQNSTKSCHVWLTS